MNRLEQVVDLEIQLEISNRFLRSPKKRYKTELLFETLAKYDFFIGYEHNLYHGLVSCTILSDILESNAIMGPALVQEYLRKKEDGEEYEFPQYEIMMGNPPDSGNFVGFANLDHASHIATLGSPLNTAFNEEEPIILGFRPVTQFPVISINYIELNNPKDGLGVIIAPKRLKEKIEAKIAECYRGPEFTRIYVSFAPITS